MVHLQSIDYETYEYYLYMDLFYYKKGTFECGTPDLTTESILDYSLTEPVYVYPVPFDDEIYIEHYSSSVLKAELMNSQGQIITQCFCPEISTKITTDDLVSGVYFLRISNVQNGQCTYRKLIRM